MHHKNFIPWIVCGIAFGAYVPILIGARQKPSELNIACYSIWLILAGMATWSSWAQKFPGWRMQFGFACGSLAVLTFGLLQGGYTFNLGPTEYGSLYGIVATIFVWTVIGLKTKRWSSRIIYWGAIFADMISFYPQFKQYLLPHEPPTPWMLLGWIMFGLGAISNALFVEGLLWKFLMAPDDFEALYEKKRNRWLVFEESAFSLENAFFVCVTLYIMWPR